MSYCVEATIIPLYKVVTIICYCCQCNSIAKVYCTIIGRIRIWCDFYIASFYCVAGAYVDDA